MEPLFESGQMARRPSPFTAQDVRMIAERRGWLVARGECATGDPDAGARVAWMADAAQLLGGQTEDAIALEALLARVFQYDARANLALPENQAVMAREGARQVLRELASLVLDSGEVNSDRYKEIVTALKERTGRRGQELFHPVRLTLAGRAGEGEFDRVILLLDAAARVEWSSKVKNCRERILEFCGTID
jgi:hypothetical protein